MWAGARAKRMAVVAKVKEVRVDSAEVKLVEATA